MSTEESDSETGGGRRVEGSNYDIIRKRLLEQGARLREQAESLNDRRQELFGSVPMTVIGQDRIRTPHSCVSQDLVHVDGKLLFGYNIFFGLKNKTNVEDVFGLHEFTRDDEGAFSISDSLGEAGLLAQSRFLRDFNDLYAYYKDARLRQLAVRKGKLLAAFQVGSTHEDLRVLRWGIGASGVEYIDNAGDKDIVPPNRHDFDWDAVRREDHVAGRHPHITILDEVFVETVGGDLTVKIEDNTEDGLGIYREPVDDPHQALGDAEVLFAKVGTLILLRILPYREDEWRHLVYNTLTKEVVRVDAIGQSCRVLPDEQGIVFPGGYMLCEGPSRTFGAGQDMRFHDVRRAPNGEDVLYIFYAPSDGSYQLLAFNVIHKEVQNPITCHGYSIFEDGVMVIFRFQGDEPTRVHPMQIWQTPFVSDEHAAAQPSGGSFLGNLGNAELVNGIRDAFTLSRMIEDQKPTLPIYEAVISSAQDVLDNYFWLEKEEALGIGASVRQIIETSELVIDEFRKVSELETQAADRLGALEKTQGELLRDVRYHDWKRVEQFVEALGALRGQRGRIISARDTRFIDLERLDELEEEVAQQYDDLSKSTVDFVLKGESLAPYREGIESMIAEIDEVKTTVEAKKIADRLASMSEELSLLTEVVSGLQVEDPNQRTRLLEQIGELLGHQNRARAIVDSRRSELSEREGKAEFGVQFQILGQSVTSALGMADTPEKCDESLSRMLVQLEEMEGRFGGFEGFVERLTEKREEIYEVFESKKQVLLEERQRRAHNMQRAAGRILEGVVRRASTMDSLEALNAYFSTDAMVLKVRELAQDLRDLDDDVGADDVETQLKSARDTAIRQLRDALDLFDGDGNLIKFGEHRFSVSKEPVELTAVERDGQMTLHITGTQFFEAIEDPEYEKTRPFWNQRLVSETESVYRAEYLAASILFEAQAQGGQAVDVLHQKCQDHSAMLEIVRRAVEDRYDEGYERGVHDVDAAKILSALVSLYATAGLLRFGAVARSVAALFWSQGELSSGHWALRGASFGRLREHYGRHEALEILGDELSQHLGVWLEETGVGELFDVGEYALGEAGRYLAEELVAGEPEFETRGAAMALVEEFERDLELSSRHERFDKDVQGLEDALVARIELISRWVRGYAHHADLDGDVDSLVAEATLILTTRGHVQRRVSTTRLEYEVEGLLGQHPRVRNGVLMLRIDEVLPRLRAYVAERVPAYRAYRRHTHDLLEKERERLRVNSLEPKVLSTFVRNRLIDELYLPLIGDNLAKQIGAAGQKGRSDRSGLLLLISPPGYGKTTLMEYVSSRLGLMFMKINGPSIGHDVVSLDPAQAPNATARQEVEKINLALEMGNNVMLYLDDIQHCDSEFLQKFISLCDATRRIEGVWKGRSKTYDLRGKRFAVVMAGNPYTEAGERFTIPDMLANRADTYNLGDMATDRGDAFEMSYVENALTSHPVTADLATRSAGDIDKFAKMAQGQTIPISELEHPYSSVEAGEIVSLFEKFMSIRDVVLAVNREYIRSAAMQDEYRTEPRFQLQGSYRNMGRMIAKVSSAMTEDEVQHVIDEHYRNEAQTLTRGSEQNLLKLAKIRGTMTDEQQQRWDEILREFDRRKMLGGREDDPVARVAGPLTRLVENLSSIHGALSEQALSREISNLRETLSEVIGAVPQGRSNAADSNGTAPETQWLQALENLQREQIEVSVVGDFPGRLSDALEHQLGIIESALVPLARAIQEHFSQNEQMRAALAEILEKLDGSGADSSTNQAS